MHAASDPRENVRAFLDAFEADRSRVELALTAERDAGASGKPADDLRRALESLQEDVLAMERRAAEASYFLPPYDSRATTSAVDKLKSAVATAIADLLPRKKFSFASRKKRAHANPGGGSNPRAPDPEAPESSKPCDVSDTSSAAAVMAKVAAMTAAAEDGPGLRDVAGGPPRVIRAPVKGADATLENLADVDVFLLGTFRALRCHDLRRVRVYGGPIAGSAHVQRLEGCHVEIAARQVRVHDASAGTRFHVRTLSRPIIEHSSDLGFAPYAFEYPGGEEALAAAGLGVETDAWRDVDDFGWIKKQQSPNWRIIPEDERDAPPKPPDEDETRVATRE